MNPDNFRPPAAPGVRKVAPRLRGQRIPAASPQLFEDTSVQQNQYGYPSSGMDYSVPQQPVYDSGHGQASYYDPNAAQQYSTNQPGNMMFPGQQLLNDPMASMAMQYGQSLAGQGSEYVHKNIEKYVSKSKLKHYFFVDTTYVGKKIGLLLFPFAHSDWSVRYNPEEPVPPRDDTNAADLYIPVMSFVTYVLLAGIMLGVQGRFSPEQLGITASTALVWTTIEILALLLMMYIMNVSANLKIFDLLAYCGYKYVGMILILLACLAFHSTGYYIALGWTSLTISYFLVRSLHVVVMAQSDPASSHPHGHKRRLYTLIAIALVQPVLMWWLTRRLSNGSN